MGLNELKRIGYEFRTFRKTWRVSFKPRYHLLHYVIATGVRIRRDDSHVGAMRDAAIVDAMKRRLHGADTKG